MGYITEYFDASIRAHEHEQLHALAPTGVTAHNFDIDRAELPFTVFHKDCAGLAQAAVDLIIITPLNVSLNDLGIDYVNCKFGYLAG